MFNTIVRAAAGEAREMGLTVPVFRSPPGLADADRTIRRRRGDVIISVRSRGRSFDDVAADVVEGLLRANAVSGGQAIRVRRRLLRAIGQQGRYAA